jgi:hypothetical protein
LGDGKGNEQLEEIFLTLFDENGKLLISNEEA